MTTLSLGFAFYLVNVAVGVCAQVLRTRFGRWHHGLYAIVFVTAVIGWLASGAHAVLITIGALAVFPLARPHTWKHPALALLGLLGYVAALMSS